MVSLWGSSKQGDANEAVDQDHGDPRLSEEAPRSRSSREYTTREPDERTRLIPVQQRPLHNDGYLDPDDPAVSPQPFKLCRSW